MFDVILYVSYVGSIKSGESIYLINQVEYVWSIFDEKWEYVCYQVNVGYYYGGGMNQCIDGSWIFYGVW